MAVKRPSYPVEDYEMWAETPELRMVVLTLAAGQEVPWHFHTRIRDTFYVLQGRVRIQLREPDAEVVLGPGETTTVEARRPHRATSAGDRSAVFLILQGMGEYDFIPLS